MSRRIAQLLDVCPGWMVRVFLLYVRWLYAREWWRYGLACLSPREWQFINGSNGWAET